nr:MAG TPA: hypothetical protein [Bacteriophage sp.]
MLAISSIISSKSLKLDTESLILIPNAPRAFSTSFKLAHSSAL